MNRPQAGGPPLELVTDLSWHMHTRGLETARILAFTPANSVQGLLPQTDTVELLALSTAAAIETRPSAEQTGRVLTGMNVAMLAAKAMGLERIAANGAPIQSYATEMLRCMPDRRPDIINGDIAGFRVREETSSEPFTATRMFEAIKQQFAPGADVRHLELGFYIGMRATEKELMQIRTNMAPPYQTSNKYPTIDEAIEQQIAIGQYGEHRMNYELGDRWDRQERYAQNYVTIMTGIPGGYDEIANHHVFSNYQGDDGAMQQGIQRAARIASRALPNTPIFHPTELMNSFGTREEYFAWLVRLTNDFVATSRYAQELALTTYPDIFKHLTTFPRQVEFGFMSTLALVDYEQKRADAASRLIESTIGGLAIEFDARSTQRSK